MTLAELAKMFLDHFDAEDDGLVGI